MHVRGKRSRLEGKKVFKTRSNVHPITFFTPNAAAHNNEIANTTSNPPKVNQLFTVPHPRDLFLSALSYLNQPKVRQGRNPPWYASSSSATAKSHTSTPHSLAGTQAHTHRPARSYHSPSRPNSCSGSTRPRSRNSP